MSGAETVERLLAALRARDAEATAAELHPEIVATGDKGTFEGDRRRRRLGEAVRRRPPGLARRGRRDPRGRRRHVAVAARRQWRWKEDPDEVADETPFGVLFELRDGRVYRWRQNFPSIIDAIDAIEA